VPRGLFATKKLGGGHDAILQPEDLAESARPDYRAFFDGLSLPWWLAVGQRVARAMAPAERERAGEAAGLGEGLVRRWIAGRYRHRLSDGYLFHWGFHRMHDRYRVP
jgi:hypothetical protein